MTMRPFNIKALAVYGAVALLTACNQPTKTENPHSTTPQNSISTASATTDSHVGHDMNAMNGMENSPNVTQPSHVTDYMQSMTAMNEQMMSASKIANPDIAFATGMKAHHQGAIDMAKIQLKYGKDSQMRVLAEHIIKTQQAEITQMQNWLTLHKNAKADNANMAKSLPEMEMTHNNKFSHDAIMQGVMDSDPDIAFAKGMIPHHQGAIDMANMELNMGKDKEMLDLAKRIKSTQDPEIKQMQAWLISKDAK